ncbi:MAG: glutathione S-transferase N-terminal domain-containing protein [Solirubrobacteraceae bacterium]|nr:glutathione S-transferase N-terminal domain-containing protein [Solirubrobacteraceae bacterium]
MRPRLITIPISHYCEKARWALDRAGIAYDEQPHVQFAHVWAAKRAGGGRTVPVLVTADGVLRESAQILAWADRGLADAVRLYPGGDAPAARALEARFDAGLGPDGRLWMYHATLPVVRDMAPWALAGVPARERRAFERFGGLLDPAIRRYLGVSAERAAAALARVRADFDHVAALLADGRPHLLGERFTAADLAFGALSAAVLIPPDYGSPLPPPDVLPEAMRAEIARLREHPAGRYAAALYATERRRTVV